MNDYSAMFDGEGDVKNVTSVRRRKTCDECGEPATARHTYLLDNARRNPESSAYGRDDISWCMDHEIYTCEACKAPSVPGHGWCSTFPATQKFQHMFLEWVKLASNTRTAVSAREAMDAREASKSGGSRDV